MRKVDLFLHVQQKRWGEKWGKKESQRWWSTVKQNQFKFGVPSINFLGDTAGKDATQDHEASWTINPINHTNNTHSGILATRISSSFIAIFGQVQPSWALSRFWQVCRHLFLVQHQPFRSACPICQRALGSPQTQSHVEIKFKDSKRWIFDLKNPDIIENHRNSWVNFMQIRKVSNIRMKVIDSQLRLPGLPAVGQPLYPKNVQKSHLKHLYVLRTTSTSMAGSNLLQNPKFIEKFSHQLSTQRFRRSFSCIQRWKQKFQKNHSFSHLSFAALVFLALFLKNSNLRSSVMASANMPLFTSIK